jgi:hypothetical protein
LRLPAFRASHRIRNIRSAHSHEYCPSRFALSYKNHCHLLKRSHNLRRRQLSTASNDGAPVSTSASNTLSTAPVARQSRDGFRELMRWTDNVLHPIRTPLGSIQPSLWNDIVMAMQVWLGYTPPVTLHDLFQQVASSSSVLVESSLPLVPRYVDTVDRLLSRLNYEHSAHNGYSSSRTHRRQLHVLHDQQLQLWAAVTCQSWLTVSKAFPDSPMAVQKASHWYDKMNNTIWSTPSNILDDTAFEEYEKQILRQKIPFFIALLQAHQRVVDTNGLFANRSVACQAAADLLLDEATLQLVIPYISDKTHTDALKACYQLSLQQCLELAAIDNVANVKDKSLSSANSTDFVTIASSVMEVMESLSESPEWSDIRFQDAELDKVLDALFLDRMKGDVNTEKKKKLSHFEREALQQRILTKINKAATLKDQETVEEMVLYWRSHMQEEEKDTLQWKPFAQAVTNFYLRLQDPVKATKWMQIQEQMPSQEAVQQAVHGTMTRPSIDMSENNVEEDINSSFEELRALNRIFAEDEQERIKQKLNLLEIWATKVRSPIIPWRATEILESLESEKGLTLETKTYTTVVKLWMANRSDSTDVASQKALDVAMRCPVFDASLLILITKLMVDRQAAGDKMNPQTQSNIIALVEEKFDEIPSDQCHDVILNAFKLLTAMPQSLDFLKFILDKNVDITGDILHGAVQSYAHNVSLFLDIFDKEKEKLWQPSYVFYKSGMQHVLSDPPTEKSCQLLAQFLSSALRMSEARNPPNNEILDVSFNAVKFVLESPKPEYYAKEILGTLEHHFLESRISSLTEDGSKVTVDMPLESLSSPIPLSFYKKVIILFGQKRSSQLIVHVYDRLKGYRSLGYTELFPDQSACAVYMKVLKEVDGLNSLDERIDQIHELIGRYETLNGENDAYRPQYLWFDILIGDLQERCKSIKLTAEQVKNRVDPYEKDSRAAVKLLEKMHSLRIVPNNLERVYPFNVAMELVMMCRNQHMHFKVVSELKQQLDDLGIVPNSYTMTLILKACERAISSKNFAALKAMVECLTFLREKGQSHPAVYMQCFKIFQLKKSFSQREYIMSEEMKSTVFQCCLDDGMLNPSIRRLFKDVSLPVTFKRGYFDQLDEGVEPAGWSRNINKASL